jgi:methyl-accepting chemotaxis protein
VALAVRHRLEIDRALKQQCIPERVKKMKIRHQILAFGCCGVFGSTFIGGLGLWQIMGFPAQVANAVSSGQSLQASQAADMMHDAIRGDAQLALLGAARGEPALIVAAEQDLRDHKEEFKTQLEAVQALPMSAATRSALQAVKPVVVAYADAARSALEEAKTGASGGAQAQLQMRFLELEVLMGRLTESLQAENLRHNTEASDAVTSSTRIMTAALLLVAVVLVAGAIMIAKRMQAPMQHAVSVADRLAAGQLGVVIEPRGNDETFQLLGALLRLRDGVGEIVRNVKENADNVAIASAEIARGNSDLSQRTEQQASSLQETAASMEQLGSTVRLNAENAGQANQLALSASDVAVRGGEVVGRVVQTMKGINDSSRKIADIIGVIDGIAFQTNILALNAAVEAARAGEQGRGFAVVAGEVRNLAQRSADAAREIKGLISASVQRVQEGTALVNQAGETMSEVVGSIRRVSDIVAEISSASREQSAGVLQVGQAVSQMDQATQQNAALVEQSAAAANGLQKQAQELVGAVAVFTF